MGPDKGSAAADILTITAGELRLVLSARSWQMGFRVRSPGKCCLWAALLLLVYHIKVPL